MSPTFIYKEMCDGGEDFRMKESIAEGLWYRVFPNCWKEIAYLQMLIKGVQILAPAKGNGVLVRADAMPL